MDWAKAHGWARARTLLAIVTALTCAWPALAQTPDLAVRLGMRGAGTRVVIDSAEPISARRAPAEDGRIVFTLTGLTPPQDLSGDGLGLIKGWRLNAGEGGAHLTLDLAGGNVAVHHFLILPGADAARYRYVIDLTPQGQTSTVAATSGEITAVAAAAPSRSTRIAKLARAEPAPVRRSVRKVVVIDAGHGGHDPGAQSADANEKDITLAAALALRTRLERSGRYRVVMTRSTDVFVPLEERVRIARRAGADLFIALHADSAGADAKAHGASVYTLSDHGETRVGEVLGGHEWFNHAAARSDPAVNGILLDLTQRSTLNRSSAFAQLLIERLSDKIDLLPNSHRDAGYFVLLAPDVPAVLLEMGFITCPADQARLTDPAQRRELTDAVADAIDAYFAGEVRVAAR